MKKYKKKRLVIIILLSNATNAIHNISSSLAKISHCT